MKIEGRLHRRPLVHDVARIAVHRDLSFAIYGATADENAKALCSIRKIYPQVRITRSSHGYLTEGEQRKFVAEVAAARTDILWVCLGVPCEQQFYYKWRRQLTGVGVVKSGGGLLNFLSGSCRRAPCKKSDRSGYSGSRWSRDSCFFDIYARLLMRLFSFYFEREDFPQMEAVHSGEENWKYSRDQTQRCTGRTRPCFLGQIARFRSS